MCSITVKTVPLRARARARGVRIITRVLSPVTLHGLALPASRTSAQTLPARIRGSVHRRRMAWCGSGFWIAHRLQQALGAGMWRRQTEGAAIGIFGCPTVLPGLDAPEASQAGRSEVDHQPGCLHRHRVPALPRRRIMADQRNGAGGLLFRRHPANRRAAYRSGAAQRVQLRPCVIPGWESERVLPILAPLCGFCARYGRLDIRQGLHPAPALNLLPSVERLPQPVHSPSIAPGASPRSARMVHPRPMGQGE